MTLGRKFPQVELGGELVTLRPSLLCAMRLHRRYGDFGSIARKIGENHLGTYCDIIGDHVDMPFLSRHVWEAGLDILTRPLLDYVVMCAGFDPDEPMPHPEESEEEAKNTPPGDYHQALFEVATGWLGWPPEVAWDSTPAEILSAHRGRVAMLKQIFGGEKKDISLNDKFALAFAGRATTVVHRSES